MSEQYLSNMVWMLEHTTAADRRYHDEVTGRMAAELARFTRGTMRRFRMTARWLRPELPVPGGHRPTAAER